MKVSDLIVKCT